MDRSDFGQIMLVLVNAFPSTREVPKRVLDVYFQFLKGQERTVLAEASVVAITEETFFPSIAKLLELCRAQSGDGPPIAAAAWEEVLLILAGTPSRTLPHPAVSSAMRVLGPARDMKTGDRTANRARFLEAYADAVRFYWRRQQVATMPARLTEG